MIRLRIATIAAVIACAFFQPLQPVQAQDRAPTVTLQSILNFSLYDNGYLDVDYTDVAFAPDGAVDAKIIIRTAAGAEVGSWAYYEDYRVRQAVFGRMTPNNQAAHTFTPGDYILEFVIAGQTATSVPFSVKQHAKSDDPFDPGETFKFVGPWQKWAYLAPHGRADDSAAAIYFWAGASDLPPGVTRVPAFAKIFRNDVLIGHSNRRTAMIDHNWMAAKSYFFQEPHEDNKSHLAKNLTMADLAQDGQYRVEITLVETGETIRAFEYAAAAGKITPHPRTVLGTADRTAYIAPRVTVKGSSTYEFREAHWITAAD